MKKYFKSAGFEIFPFSGKVLYQQETVKIRPKTLQLLVLLLEANGEVVDKQTILRQIWDDVLVDDQVIFQSIKELRKVFSGLDVIKTQPRKGYAWISGIEICDLEIKPQPPSVKSSADTKAEGVLATLFHKKYLIASLFLLVMVIILISINTEIEIIASDSTSLKQAAQDKIVNKIKIQPTVGSIIILPLSTDLTDTNHRWVRYGVMDQLIQRLKPSDTYGVIQTEDVLDIMKRADMPLANHQRSDIERMFKVSGASLIVDIKLSGDPGDYHLFYSFHNKGNIRRGVVIKPQISLAVNKIANLISDSLGQSVEMNNVKYKSNFANQMLATALELMQSEDYGSSANFLEATITTEPENLVAKRLLAQTKMFRGLIHEATETLSTAVKQALLLNNQRELARLRFWSAINALQKKQADEALVFLKLAIENANNVKDWLYLGYIEEVMGEIYHSKKDYELAKKHYLLAMDNHQIIQCPYGRSQGFINLSELSFAQGDYKTAIKQVNQALDIIEERELPQLKEAAVLWQKKVNNKLNEMK